MLINALWNWNSIGTTHLWRICSLDFHRWSLGLDLLRFFDSSCFSRRWLEKVVIILGFAEPRKFRCALLFLHFSLKQFYTFALILGLNHVKAIGVSYQKIFWNLFRSYFRLIRRSNKCIKVDFLNIAVALDRVYQNIVIVVQFIDEIVFDLVVRDEAIVDSNVNAVASTSCIVVIRQVLVDLTVI